jgi:hypothetical protein
LRACGLSCAALRACLAMFKHCCVHLSALPRATRAICRAHPRDVPGGMCPRRGRARRHRGVAVRARAALGRRARVRAPAGILDSCCCRVFLLLNVPVLSCDVSVSHGMMTTVLSFSSPPPRPPPLPTCEAPGESMRVRYVAATRMVSVMRRGRAYDLAARPATAQIAPMQLGICGCACKCGFFSSHVRCFLVIRYACSMLCTRRTCSYRTCVMFPSSRRHRYVVGRARAALGRRACVRAAAGSL